MNVATHRAVEQGDITHAQVVDMTVISAGGRLERGELEQVIRRNVEKRAETRALNEHPRVSLSP